VALEFNLIVESKTPQKAYLKLLDLVKDYISTVKEFKLRPFALNQVPDKEYLNL